MRLHYWAVLPAFRHFVFNTPLISALFCDMSHLAASVAPSTKFSTFVRRGSIYSWPHVFALFCDVSYFAAPVATSTKLWTFTCTLASSVCSRPPIFHRLTGALLASHDFVFLLWALDALDSTITANVAHYSTIIAGQVATLLILFQLCT